MAVLAATALIGAGCGGDSKTSSTNASPEEAKQALVAALKNTGSLKTGTIELDGTIGFTGGGAAANAGNITFKGSGPFDISDPKNQKVDLKIDMGVAGQTQTIGVIAVDGKTYIEFAGQAIELDKKSSGSVTDLTESLGPGSIANLSKNLEGNLTNVKKTTTTNVGGVELTTYTGEVDFSKVLESFSGTDGASGVLGGLTGTEAKQAKEAFKARKVEFGVDEADNVVRSMTLEADIEDPTGKEAGSGSFELSLKILEADGPVEITAPENPIQGGGAALGGLLGGMGGTSQ